MKLGRNDPCHCGRGKKYKKCHMAQDEAGRLKAPPPANEELTKAHPEAASRSMATMEQMKGPGRL
jgi:hypothetical protein